MKSLKSLVLGATLAVMILAIGALPNFQINSTTDTQSQAVTTQVVTSTANVVTTQTAAPTFTLSIGVQTADAFYINGDPSGWNYTGNFYDAICDYFGFPGKCDEMMH